MNYKKQDDELMINKGHGTRTESVICGYERGKYRGVAPGVPVIPYRAVNGVDLNTRRSKWVAQALCHAVEGRLCEVVSTSASGAVSTPQVCKRELSRLMRRGRSSWPQRSLRSACECSDTERLSGSGRSAISH